MGIDCTAVMEYDEQLGGKPYWVIKGCEHLDRNTEFFQIITENAIPGYPDDISRTAKEILETNELYGECWMTMKDYDRLCEEHGYGTRFIRRRFYKRMRIVFRFDR